MIELIVLRIKSKHFQMRISASLILVALVILVIGTEAIKVKTNTVQGARHLNLVEAKKDDDLPKRK